MPKLFQLSIREIAMLTIIVGVLLAWWRQEASLQQEIDKWRNRSIILSQEMLYVGIGVKWSEESLIVANENNGETVFVPFANGTPVGTPTLTTSK